MATPKWMKLKALCEYLGVNRDIVKNLQGVKSYKNGETRQATRLYEVASVERALRKGSA